MKSREIVSARGFRAIANDVHADEDDLRRALRAAADRITHAAERSWAHRIALEECVRCYVPLEKGEPIGPEARKLVAWAEKQLEEGDDDGEKHPEA